MTQDVYTSPMLLFAVVVHKLLAGTSYFTLEINEFRCYEAKIEESEAVQCERKREKNDNDSGRASAQYHASELT